MGDEMMNVGHWVPVYLHSNNGLLLDPVGSNSPWEDWAYVRNQFWRVSRSYFDTLPNIGVV